MNAVGFGADGLVGGSLAAVLQGLGAAGKGALVNGVVMAAMGVVVTGIAVKDAMGSRVGNLSGNPQDRWVVAEHDYGWVHVHWYALEAEARAAFNAGHLRRILVDTAQGAGAREVGHEGKAPWVDDAMRTVLRQLHVL